MVVYSRLIPVTDHLAVLLFFLFFCFALLRSRGFDSGHVLFYFFLAQGEVKESCSCRIYICQGVSKSGSPQATHKTHCTPPHPDTPGHTHRHFHSKEKHLGAKTWKIQSRDRIDDKGPRSAT